MFSAIKCAPLFYKIEKDFNIDDYERNFFWWNSFLNTFECICFKHPFDLENFEFWGCVFNKSHSFLCYSKHGCTIWMIKTKI